LASSPVPSARVAAPAADTRHAATPTASVFMVGFISVSVVMRSSRPRPGSLPRGEAREGADLDRAAPQEDRTALGQFGGGIQGVGLEDGDPADDLLGLHERPVGDELLSVDDAAFLLQPVAGVEHPALPEPLGDPCLPLLELLLHLLGRQGAVRLAGVAVDEE